METLIVYSLVLLFFILLCVFTVGVLARQPYREPQAVTTTHTTMQENAAEAGSKGAYAVLAVLLLLFFVITLLSERQQAHAQAS